MLRSLLDRFQRWDPLTWAGGGALLDVAVSALLVLALALPVWSFLRALPLRLTYPFELEWMEGGIVSHVRVILDGQPLYRAPSLGFTPFIYPPLYYYVTAALAKVVGLGYLAPRLLSSFAITGCFALLFLWVWRETKSPLAGWVASGTFAATYELSGRWFDIARGDSLLLFLLLAACLAGRWNRGPAALVCSGVLLALAFFTKQSALGMALPILMAAALRDPRRGWLASLVFVFLVAAGVLALNLESDGWFWFYAFEVPAHHAVFWGEWRGIVFDPIWPATAPMMMATLAVICGVPRLAGGTRSWPASGLFVLSACAGAVLGLLHTGGYINVLMPAFAAMAFSMGLVFARLRRAGGPERLSLRGLAAALVLIQLGLLPRAGASAAPRPVDVAAGQRMVQELSKLEGPIWCTASNYYPVLAGHPETFTHVMGLVDVFKSSNEPVKTRLLAELERELSSGRIPSIVLDRAAGFLPESVVGLIRQHYQLTGHLMSRLEASALWPSTGAAIRPDEVWTFTPQGKTRTRAR